MMSNEGEKRCPLCAEEMDWTDQQFRPCKCGYQICVWCWHHIIDMAEKDAMEGRCPACRTIYEKEKIISMQANCERTMSKISSRKTKPPKAKSKDNNELKKDLTKVRVIQRKMAYVIGLPHSLANEAVLMRKEYFGQYGKVIKVSLSRSAGGAIQQFINDTCSVYITYSKEEEALRCIQSVHGFVLEGRLLRASFGTAKYCHAWLKNMPCNSPTCLYLHTIGSDEDSFGKDEVAAVQTRSRVQQIVAVTNSVVKRSGSMLPPPADITCSSSSSITDKPSIRSTISGATHGSPNSTDNQTFSLTSVEKEGANAAARKTLSFVDIVGRSNCAALEEDVNVSDDTSILNLCSELSSVTNNGDPQAGELYLFPTVFEMSHSNHSGNGLYESIPDDQPFLSDDHNPSHNRETEAALPIRCVNSVLTDSFQEMKFQNSAKSDRIYRSSNSFSNEEIVEQLRRIDDGDLNNQKESSILDAAESSIISNIMSIGLDSCEDSLTMSKCLSEFLDETDGLGCSSLSFLNSDRSAHSFVKHEGFKNQMTRPIPPEYGDYKEQYFPKPHYPVRRSRSLAPPGFPSVPSRDPPPGFSTNCIGALSRASSGTALASFPNAFVQPPSMGTTNCRIAETELFKPSLSNCSQGKFANGFSNNNSFPSAFKDEPRLWHPIQQPGPTRQDSMFSQAFLSQNRPTQQEPSYKDHRSNGLSRLDGGMYGLSSRAVNEHSFFAHDHSSVSNMSNGEVMGMAELGRNERISVDYVQGYGDLRFNSGDVYTRVFGL